MAELARILRTENVALKILVLTGDLSEKSVRHALAAGVDGYVVKSDEVDELLTAISAVLAGECYVSRALASELSLKLADDTNAATERDGKLTQRELEVLALIGQGFSSAAIADKLGLAVRTVRKHRENILRKLDMHNMAQLTAYGIKAGLLN